MYYGLSITNDSDNNDFCILAAWKLFKKHIVLKTNHKRHLLQQKFICFR